MKLLQFHLLQTYPLNCLNRNEVGSPKSTMYGDVERTLISSQCLKRAIREFARNLLPEVITGRRTREILPLLEQALLDAGVTDPETAKKYAKEAATLTGYIPAEKEKSGKGKAKGKAKQETGDEDVDGTEDSLGASVFVSPSELATVAKAYLEGIKNGGKPTKAGLRKAAEQSVGKAGDVALFGRMMASAPELNVEGAVYSNFAFTTHKAHHDFDFFIAMEEVTVGNGAASMGNIEFSAGGVYYRYFALDLDMLKANLGKLGSNSAHVTKLVETVIRAVIQATPSARQHSMASASIPDFGIITLHEGTPLQYGGAYETPVQAGKDGGYRAASISALEDYHRQQTKALGATYALELRFPEVNLEDAIKKIAATL